MPPNMPDYVAWFRALVRNRLVGGAIRSASHLLTAIHFSLPASRARVRLTGEVPSTVHESSPLKNGAPKRAHRTLKRQAIKPVRPT